MVFLREPEPPRAAILGGAEAEVLLREIIDAFGGDEAMAAIDADRDAGWDYLQAHYDELLAKYPDESIALPRDRVVVHAASQEEFSRLLEEYLERTGTHPCALEMHHLDPDPPLLAV